jgi:hypothetical protein
MLDSLRMRKVWGWVGVGFGLFMGLGVLVAGAGHGVLTILVTLAIFSVLPIGIGWRCLRPQDDRRALAAHATQAWESEILRLAEKRGGGLTVAEVVAHADLDAGAAERVLDDLARRGMAEHRVTDDGEIVYRFPVAPSAEQKRRAQGVLDE